MTNLIIVEGKVFKVVRRDFKLGEAMQYENEITRQTFIDYINRNYEPIQKTIPILANEKKILPTLESPKRRF